MDSNSLDKGLNSILNTLPHTVAPLGAGSYSVIKIKQKFDKKKKFKIFKQNWGEIAIFTSRLLPFNGFFLMSWIYWRPCLKESRKQKVNKNLENWQCVISVRLKQLEKNIYVLNSKTFQNIFPKILQNKFSNYCP
jgi:hypothetical protein